MLHEFFKLDLQVDKKKSYFEKSAISSPSKLRLFFVAVKTFRNSKSFYTCTVSSWSILFLILHSGNVHGAPACAGSGRLPPLPVGRLPADPALRHPAQAAGQQQHGPGWGPPPRALAAVRPSDLLHQQSVSDSGLLWKHWSTGGMPAHTFTFHMSHLKSLKGPRV